MSAETEYAGKLGTLIGAETAFETCARLADEAADEAGKRGACEAEVHLRAFAAVIRSTVPKWVDNARANLLPAEA
jgi:hypothetical protein